MRGLDENNVLSESGGSVFVDLDRVISWTLARSEAARDDDDEKMSKNEGRKDVGDWRRWTVLDVADLSISCMRGWSVALSPQCQS